MRFIPALLVGLPLVAALPAQVPLLRHANTDRAVSIELFSELEELARIVDISYCVGLTGLGITQPFQCLSHCSEFPSFELITVSRKDYLLENDLADTCRHGTPANSCRILAATLLLTTPLSSLES